MAGRQWVNGGLIGGVAIGSIGTFANIVVWVLDQIGRAQTAKTIYDALGPLKMRGLTMNWGVIYFYVAALSLAVLVALNWRDISRWRVSRAKERQREWNASFSEGAQYVAFASYFGDALQTTDVAERLKSSILALWESGQKGTLAIAAIPRDAALPKRLSRRELRSLKIQFKTPQSHSMHGYTDMNIYELKLIDAYNRPMYDKVLIDRDEVRRLWPPAPERFNRA